MLDYLIDLVGWNQLSLIAIVTRLSSALAPSRRLLLSHSVLEVRRRRFRRIARVHSEAPLQLGNLGHRSRERSLELSDSSEAGAVILHVPLKQNPHPNSRDFFEPTGDNRRGTVNGYLDRVLEGLWSALVYACDELKGVEWKL
jgi:hypothetical protein